MNIRTTIILAATALALVAPTAVHAAPADRIAPAPDLRLPGRHGRVREGVRCATSHVNAGLARRTPPAGLSGLRSTAGAGPVRNVPVAVHVMYGSKRGMTLGNVSLARIEEQVDVLNDAYAGKGFSFYLASVDRTLSNKWFTGCYSLATESEFKQALAIDPATTLNIYTCQPSQNILGYAYYPSSFDEDSFMHGAVLHHASLPGGSFGDYSEGDTGVHEVGHYLGLYHTFEGACTEPGDHVDDTPPEASPAYECDETRDTCGSPGLDPIHNFMDYTPDTCMFEFTDGQTQLMDQEVTLYRPSLGGDAEGCGDGTCSSGEECSCEADCTAPATEGDCNDGADEDCDGATDCADTDCSGGPSCPSCSASGASCSGNSECCSGQCKGKPGNRTCR